MTKMKLCFMLGALATRTLAFTFQPKYFTASGIRHITLPGKRQRATGLSASVTGPVFTSDDGDVPVVQIFTKEGCTLCDKVIDVLRSIQEEEPHSLEAIDITDEDNAGWWSKYKYDIPVLHIGDQYWIKHRIDEMEARKGLQEARSGNFLAREGEPDAGEMEARQAKRQQN